jgi:hypothetical protein
MAVLARDAILKAIKAGYAILLDCIMPLPHILPVAFPRRVFPSCTSVLLPVSPTAARSRFSLSMKPLLAAPGTSLGVAALYSFVFSFFVRPLPCSSPPVRRSIDLTLSNEFRFYKPGLQVIPVQYVLARLPSSLPSTAPMTTPCSLPPPMADAWPTGRTPTTRTSRRRSSSRRVKRT